MWGGGCVSGTGRPDHTPPHLSRGACGGKRLSARLSPWAVAAMSGKTWREWTTHEIDVMRANGHLGVDAVQRALLRECGSDRSVRSIESQASRCHVSLRVQQVCPDCGVVGVRLNRQSGLCPKCTELMHLNEEIAFNEVLQREREEKADSADMTSIRRERNRMRQRNSRLARKYGLPSRRDRRGK